MQVWKCCTRFAENTGRKSSSKIEIWSPSHICRAISSQLRHLSTIGKQFVKQQYLLHYVLQYDQFRPTNGWDRFGYLRHPTYCQRVTRFGRVALLHDTLVVGVSQTLQRWTQGATYIRQGGHHVGHWPTFLVSYFARAWESMHRVKWRHSDLWSHCDL